MKRLFFTFIIVFVWSQIYSQPKQVAWQLPTIEEVTMQIYEPEPDAPAVILRERADVYFDDWREELRLFYQVHQRIKILKPEGKKYAHLKIPYISYDYFEDFPQLKVIVYRLEKGIIKRKKVKRKYFKYHKINELFTVVEVEIPDLQVGDVVDFIYTFATFRFVQPWTWYFQKDIPVIYSEFNANIPDFMKYYFNIVGEEFLDEKKIEDSYLVIDWTATYKDPIPSGLYYHGYNFRANVNFNFNSKYYHFVMKNIPSFKPEPYIDNPQNYYYQVQMNLYYLTKDIGYNSPIETFLWEQFSKRMYLTTFMNYYPMSKQRTKIMAYPAAYVIFDATDWNYLAQQLRKEIAFYQQLKRFVNVTPTVSKLTKDINNPQQKMIKIYQFVKDSIQWNQNFRLFVSDYLSEIWKKRSGNSADKNLLLIYMLKKAGLNAYPVAVKTVNKGHLIPQLAAFYQFNHVIAAVEIGKKTYLLDATSDKPWYLIPQYDHNQIAFAIKNDTSFFVSLTDNIKTFENYNLTIDLKNMQSNLIYKTQGISNFTTLNPYEAIEADFKIIDQKSQNPYSFEYSLQIPINQFITTTDTTIIITPFKPFAQIKAPINYTRRLPVYFYNPFNITYNIQIILPDTIKFPALPNNFFSLPNAKASISSKQIDNKLIIILNLDFQSYYFPQNQIIKLNQLFKFYTKWRNFKIILPKTDKQ